MSPENPGRFSDEKMLVPDGKGYYITNLGAIAAARDLEQFEYLKRILPRSEVIQQSLHTEVSVYPEIALRELIANALIHQDFSITAVQAR